MEPNINIKIKIPIEECKTEPKSRSIHKLKKKVLNLSSSNVNKSKEHKKEKKHKRKHSKSYSENIIMPIPIKEEICDEDSQENYAQITNNDIEMYSYVDDLNKCENNKSSTLSDCFINKSDNSKLGDYAHNNLDSESNFDESTSERKKKRKSNEHFIRNHENIMKNHKNNEPRDKFVTKRKSKDNFPIDSKVGYDDHESNIKDDRRCNDYRTNEMSRNSSQNLNEIYNSTFCEGENADLMKENEFLSPICPETNFDTKFPTKSKKKKHQREKKLSDSLLLKYNELDLLDNELRDTNSDTSKRKSEILKNSLPNHQIVNDLTIDTFVLNECVKSMSAFAFLNNIEEIYDDNKKSSTYSKEFEENIEITKNKSKKGRSKSEEIEKNETKSSSKHEINVKKDEILEIANNIEVFCEEIQRKDDEIMKSPLINNFSRKIQNSSNIFEKIKMLNEKRKLQSTINKKNITLSPESKNKNEKSNISKNMSEEIIKSPKKREENGRDYQETNKDRISELLEESSVLLRREDKETIESEKEKLKQKKTEDRINGSFDESTMLLEEKHEQTIESLKKERKIKRKKIHEDKMDDSLKESRILFEEKGDDEEAIESSKRKKERKRRKQLRALQTELNASLGELNILLDKETNELPKRKKGKEIETHEADTGKSLNKSGDIQTNESSKQKIKQKQRNYASEDQLKEIVEERIKSRKKEYKQKKIYENKIDKSAVFLEDKETIESPKGKEGKQLKHTETNEKISEFSQLGTKSLILNKELIPETSESKRRKGINDDRIKELSQLDDESKILLEKDKTIKSYKRKKDKKLKENDRNEEETNDISHFSDDSRVVLEEIKENGSIKSQTRKKDKKRKQKETNESKSLSEETKDKTITSPKRKKDKKIKQNETNEFLHLNNKFPSLIQEIVSADNPNKESKRKNDKKRKRKETNELRHSDDELTSLVQDIVGDEGIKESNEFRSSVDTTDSDVSSIKQIKKKKKLQSVEMREEATIKRNENSIYSASRRLNSSEDTTDTDRSLDFIKERKKKQKTSTFSEEMINEERVEDLLETSEENVRKLTETNEEIHLPKTNNDTKLKEGNMTKNSQSKEEEISTDFCDSDSSFNRHKKKLYSNYVNRETTIEELPKTKKSKLTKFIKTNETELKESFNEQTTVNVFRVDKIEQPSINNFLRKIQSASNIFEKIKTSNQKRKEQALQNKENVTSPTKSKKKIEKNDIPKNKDTLEALTESNIHKNNSRDKKNNEDDLLSNLNFDDIITEVDEELSLQKRKEEKVKDETKKSVKENAKIYEFFEKGASTSNNLQNKDILEKTQTKQTIDINNGDEINKIMSKSDLIHSNNLQNEEISQEIQTKDGTKTVDDAGIDKIRTDFGELRKNEILLKKQTKDAKKTIGGVINKTQTNLDHFFANTELKDNSKKTNDENDDMEQFNSVLDFVSNFTNHEKPLTTTKTPQIYSSLDIKKECDNCESTEENTVEEKLASEISKTKINRKNKESVGNKSKTNEAKTKLKTTDSETSKTSKINETIISPKAAEKSNESCSKLLADSKAKKENRKKTNEDLQKKVKSTDSSDDDSIKEDSLYISNRELHENFKIKDSPSVAVTETDILGIRNLKKEFEENDSDCNDNETSSVNQEKLMREMVSRDSNNDNSPLKVFNKELTKESETNASPRLKETELSEKREKKLKKKSKCNDIYSDTSDVQISKVDKNKQTKIYKSKRAPSTNSSEKNIDKSFEIKHRHIENNEDNVSHYEIPNKTKRNSNKTKSNKSSKQNSKESVNQQSNESPESNQITLLNYFDRIISERYNYQSVSLFRSEDSNMKAVSEFETEQNDSDEETDRDNVIKETKLKMLEIMSMEDERMLNVLEKNEKLTNLVIRSDWDLPLLHKVETRVTSTPTAAQQALFSQMNVEMKTGPFSQAEDDIIKGNFEKFCKQYDLEVDPAPFLKFLYGKTHILKERERINFVRYLGKGLNNRKLYRIYARFQILYGNNHVGRFTEEEDLVIKNYLKIMKDDPNKFSSLSKILKRRRVCIHRRWQTLELLKDLQHLAPENYENIIKSLMEVTKTTKLQDLRNREITQKEWMTLSRKLNMNKDKLSTFWHASLYTKIFHEGPIKVDEILKKLLDELDRKEEDDYRTLNWNLLAKPYENVTRGFLYRLFKNARRQYVPKEHHSSLRSCVTFLKELYEKEGKLFPDIPNIVLIDL